MILSETLVHIDMIQTEILVNINNNIEKKNTYWL